MSEKRCSNSRRPHTFRPFSHLLVPSRRPTTHGEDKKRWFVEGLIGQIESRLLAFDKDVSGVETVTPGAVLYFLDSDCSDVQIVQTFRRSGRKIGTVNALLYMFEKIKTGARFFWLYMVKGFKVTLACMRTTEYGHTVQ